MDRCKVVLFLMTFRHLYCFLELIYKCKVQLSIAAPLGADYRKWNFHLVKYILVYLRRNYK